jgi:fructose-1-phosphate kinase PfkB-like protein
MTPIHIFLASIFSLLICAVFVLIIWDFKTITKRQKAFTEKKPELLAIVRARMETETKEQLVQRLVNIAGNLPPRVLEETCKRIIDSLSKNL